MTRPKLDFQAVSAFSAWYPIKPAIGIQRWWGMWVAQQVVACDVAHGLWVSDGKPLLTQERADDGERRRGGRERRSVRVLEIFSATDRNC